MGSWYWYCFQFQTFLLNNKLKRNSNAELIITCKYDDNCMWNFKMLSELPTLGFGVTHPEGEQWQGWWTFLLFKLPGSFPVSSTASNIFSFKFYCMHVQQRTLWLLYRTTVRCQNWIAKDIVTVLYRCQKTLLLIWTILVRDLRNIFWDCYRTNISCLNWYKKTNLLQS